MEIEEESELPEILRAVKSYDFELRSVLYTILKILLLINFTLFILYLPLGDPNQQCGDISLTRGSSFAYNRNTPAYAYMCNVYRAISFTAVHTGNVVQKTAQFSACVVMNVLYDIKLKFYSLLEKVDRQDLCRSICCSEAEEFQDVPTQTEERRRALCKCRGKFCRKKKI